MYTTATKTKQAPSRDHKAEQRTATLPTETVEPLAVAKAATEDFNAAVVNADDARAEELASAVCCVPVAVEEDVVRRKSRH